MAHRIFQSIFKTLFFLLILLAAFPQVIQAQPISPEEIPPDLRPWVDWVLKDQREAKCPYLQGDSDRECTWASPLNLTLNETGGSFSQQWKVDAPSWVPLPGDEDHWPQEVQSNGKGVVVLNQEGAPFLYLQVGTYNITGQFTYDQIPESFTMPSTTGILRLTVKGEAKPFPQIDAEKGVIWLQHEVAADEEENRLEMRVHRKLTDTIPFRLTTQMTLNVSGQSREIVLPKVLPEGFIPMELKSPIPARVENGRDLRIQVKAGEWNVELVARHQGPLNQLTLGEHEAPWPSDEVWVFQAMNDLRLVWVKGVPSIDPQQTTLPDAWKKFPAYRMKPGATLTLEEKRRGNSDPAPDQLNLFREWWLDFNGGGFTIHDNIDGVLRRSWRLEMNPPVLLGRLSVDDKDQFITRLPGEKRLGVEVRQGRVEVSADSRIDEGLRRVPAVGWNQDFQSVSGELNLPPGWRLFSVSGADRVPDTWVESWTLLDIFLVLITALIFFKFWGWKWGGIALLTLVLTFPEGDSPKWIWLALLLGFALLRILPPGKIHSLLKFYKIVTLLLLILFAIPFMVQQVRVGLYPALEHPHEYMGVTAPGAAPRRKMRPKRAIRAMPAPAGAPAPMEEAEDMERKVEVQQQEPSSKISLSSGSLGGRKGQDNYYQINRQVKMQEQRPGTKVQTGPGLPRWEWNRFPLEWNGPVQKDQTLIFFLIPPWANLVLAFLRVALLILLILCVLQISKDQWRSFLKPKLSVLLLPFLVGTLLPIGLREARADFPSKELLDQLQERLLENPECYPDCADISKMNLEVSADQLRARLRVQTQIGAAIPLPGSTKEWNPQQVSLDGQPFAGLFRDGEGRLWLEVPPGVHDVVLTGALPVQETVQLSLPLKPHQVFTQLQGWTLSGLRENGIPDDTLQLTRIPMAGAPSEARRPGTAPNGGLPPFVTVKRELVLGLNWEVLTRVERVTPEGTPVVLEVPLLAGESVITPGIRVEGGKALVNMGPNASLVEWRSVLNESAALDLQAPEAGNYMEVWNLDVSPVWHVEFQGIPMIHSADPMGSYLPEWRPWPGESLTITVIRPEGVPGQTLTIDQSKTEVRPGLRFTEIALDLSIRSSLGGQHVLTLPSGADLQEVKINGKVEPVRMEQDKVTLPIVPGSQRVELKWQQAGGIGMLFRAPAVNLGIASVNSEIQFRMPENRWILWAGGPTMGPAVMFWSLLFVIFLFAYGLSRLGWTPLGTWQWLLLGVGVSQFPEFPVLASVFIAGWLLALGWRERSSQIGKFGFDLRQILLVAYTFFAILVLFASIHQGLLGHPEMQIGGNGSTPRLLRWFQDRSTDALERPYVISVPLFYYRLAMLAWALWIALALIKWLRWGWRAFSDTALWKPLGIIRKKEAKSS